MPVAATAATLLAFGLAPGLLVSALASPSLAAVRAATPPGSRSEVAPPAPRVAPDEPARGRFLIATPQVTGAIFARTVILLLGHGPEGTMGLIVNRLTEVKLERLLPDEQGLRELDDRVHLGGPVAHGELLLLIRAEEPPPASESVLGGVWLTASVTALREVLASGETARRLRAYVGYSGWGPGQLEREIGRGDWDVAPARADLVFSAKPDEVWDLLHFEYGGREVRGPGARPLASQRPVY